MAKKIPLAERTKKPRPRVQIRLTNPDAPPGHPKSIHHTVAETNIAEVEEAMRQAKIIKVKEKAGYQNVQKHMD